MAMLGGSKRVLATGRGARRRPAALREGRFARGCSGVGERHAREQHLDAERASQEQRHEGVLPCTTCSAASDHVCSPFENAQRLSRPQKGVKADSLSQDSAIKEEWVLLAHTSPAARKAPVGSRCLDRHHFGDRLPRHEPQRVAIRGDADWSRPMLWRGIFGPTFLHRDRLSRGLLGLMTRICVAPWTQWVVVAAPRPSAESW